MRNVQILKLTEKLYFAQNYFLNLKIHLYKTFEKNYQFHASISVKRPESLSNSIPITFFFNFCVRLEYSMNDLNKVQ